MKRLIRVSDGCAEQYKSQYVMCLLSFSCDKHNLDEIIFNSSATSGGKGPCNSLGNDGKSCVYKTELCGKCRCADAKEVFCLLIDPSIGMRRYSLY